MGQKVNPISLRLEKTNRHFVLVGRDFMVWVNRQHVRLIEDLKFLHNRKTSGCEILLLTYNYLH